MRLTAGDGFAPVTEPTEWLINQNGNFLFIVAPPPGNTVQNLPYEIDIQIDAPPPPTPTPNNWSCSVYAGTDIPKAIDDFTTIGSTLNVPASGTVTHATARGPAFGDVNECVERTVRRWRFPRTGAESRISIPFVFTGRE